SHTAIPPIDAGDLRRLADRAASIVTRGGERGSIERAVAPDGYDLWMDAATGRVVVDGSVRIELRARPILHRLLEVLLAAPGTRLAKERLVVEVWRLPSRTARDATVHKAVDRLGRLLYPDEPKRFVAWDASGRLVLRAARPCLVRQGADAKLNPRERWLVRE